MTRGEKAQRIVEVLWDSLRPRFMRIPDGPTGFADMDHGIREMKPIIRRVLAQIEEDEES